MSDPLPVEPPREIEELLVEREELHRRRQQAQHDLERQAERLRAAPPAPHDEPPEPLAPLTPEATPPAELAATLAQLDQRLAAIGQTEATVERHRAEIRRLQRRLLIVALAAALLLALVLLLVVITSR